MGKFNVTTKNGKFYDPEKIEILLGEDIIVDFVEYTGEHRFVSFNDRLLDIDDKPFTAKVKALEVGSTEIQIQDMKRTTLFYLPVEIKDVIWPDNAIELGGTVTVQEKSA